MRLSIITILIFTNCSDVTTGQSVDNFTLLEIGQKLNGHWRLKEIETKGGQKTLNLNSDNLEFYEFNGLIGAFTEMTDNHDGSFGVPTCQPHCELRERNDKKIIEYVGMFDSWELEIRKISNDELILVDSVTKKTFVRQYVKDR